MEGTAKGTTAKSRTWGTIGTRSFRRSKSFSLCCKPVVLDGSSVEPTLPSIKYVPVEPLPPGAVTFDVKDEQNKVARRRLSRVIKAVLLETSLVKKLFKRKLWQRLTVNSLQQKTEKLIHNDFTERPDSLEVKGMRTASTVSSSLRYPSSIPSPYSSCHSERDVIRAIQPCAKGVVETEHRKGNVVPNADLSLLLIMSLLILIFWGKICAIFCTSTWLFFISRWSIKPKADQKRWWNCRQGSDSQLYKKKAIMEGLLERNRSHG